MYRSKDFDLVLYRSKDGDIVVRVEDANVTILHKEVIKTDQESKDLFEVLLTIFWTN